MTATLDSVERHSMGDLTLHIFHFGSIATTDSYGVTNMPGVISAWASPWVGANTLCALTVDYSNGSTGCTLNFYGMTATTTADVFVLSHG